MLILPAYSSNWNS